MRNLTDKIRVIYVPFLFIAIGFLVGYSFLNWLLLIKLDLFALDEEVANLWLPFSLPLLPLFIWLRPRVKALRKRERKRADPRGAFWFTTWATIALTTTIAQSYLATATGTITPLAQIGQIDRVPKTKYYTLQDAVFDKADSSAKTTGSYSGRYNSSFDMTLYLVCPIDEPPSFESGAISASGGDSSPVHVWLGTIYKDHVDGHLSDDERDLQFTEFQNRSLADYDKLDLRKFSYLERIGSSADGRGFEAAVERNKLYRAGTSTIVLEAHNGNFSDPNGDKLAWVFGSFGIGALICFITLLTAPIDSKEMNRLLSGEKATDEPSDKEDQKSRLLRLVFLPNRAVFGTPLLIDINSAIFLWMVVAGLGVVSFSPEDLLAWGANFKPAVVGGEYWRLVTSLFVHGGLMHLLGNLFTLFLVGAMLESQLRPVRFLICYFVCGIAGSLASVAWHPATVSVGASGAIMGVLGVLISLTFLKTEKDAKQKNGVIKMALFIAGYNLLMGFIMSGVDNAAHVGGLVCGLFLGALFGFFPALLGHDKPRSQSRTARH